ncbi:MAG: DegV family protein [Lachnospiraceae bacterium]|nr:DegV family protein [Lachnospiraceae bacterium]
MAKFVLSCCSTADLPASHFEERAIPCLFFHYSIDGVSYPDDLGKTVPYDKFYKMIDDGAMPVTSQPNAQEYMDFWKPFLDQGKDVFHITLSSGISGAFNSAQIAKEEMSEKYPNQKIIVLDSLGASSGYGMLVDYVADLRDQGADLQEAYNWAVKNRLHVHHWFFSTNLTHYKRGGRISSTAALVGGLLRICPLMNVDHDGKLAPREKIRLKKKAIEESVNRMKEHADNGTEYDGRCYICNSACIADAEELKSKIEADFPHMKDKIVITNIGAVIGSHTGPGTIALFFMGDERLD